MVTFAIGFKFLTKGGGIKNNPNPITIGGLAKIVRISGCLDTRGLEQSIQGYGLVVGENGSVCTVAQIWNDGWAAVITPDDTPYPNQKFSLPIVCLEAQ